VARRRRNNQYVLATLARSRRSGGIADLVACPARASERPVRVSGPPGFGSAATISPENCSRSQPTDPSSTCPYKRQRARAPDCSGGQLTQVRHRYTSGSAIPRRKVASDIRSVDAETRLELFRRSPRMPGGVASGTSISRSGKAVLAAAGNPGIVQSPERRKSSGLERLREVPGSAWYGKGATRIVVRNPETSPSLY